jgi:hypothetical protein
MKNPMLDVEVETAKTAVGSASITTLPSHVTRRTGHGGVAWSLPANTQTLRQPQDGASAGRSKLSSMKSPLRTDLWQEPEDARLTGGTRSLTRRLLGLNLAGKLRKTPTTVSVPLPHAQVA